MIPVRNPTSILQMALVLLSFGNLGEEDRTCGPLSILKHPAAKRNRWGTPNREPKEFGRNATAIQDPGRYIPGRLLLFSCGNSFWGPHLNLSGCWGRLSASAPSVKDPLNGH